MFSLATWVTLFQRAVMQGVPILFGATGEIRQPEPGYSRYYVCGRYQRRDRLVSV